MRLLHFNELQPVCPSCKRNNRFSSLNLSIGEEEKGDIKSGLLSCVATDCGRTYPIIYGCPILVPDIETWLTANLHLILQQEIADPMVENLISEVVSPDTAYNITRQQQSSYCADHYRQEFSKDTNTQPTNQTISTVRNCLSKSLDFMPNNKFPSIDIGCAVGSTTFDIANKRQSLTLGIDLNWPLLNISRKVLDDGVISYPHRIIGNRYERRKTKVSYASSSQCDFWIADATCLPFRDHSFGLAIGLNIIDCVVAPKDLLTELLRIVKLDGGISIACPFDWASHSTNHNNWIYGGADLDKIISGITLPVNREDEKYFHLSSPPLEIEWSLPLHERAKITYLTRLYMMQVSILRTSE